MRSVLRYSLVLLILACAAQEQDKAPFDDSGLDDELAADPGKADYFTTRTLYAGTITPGTPVNGEFLAGRLLGYGFSGTGGDTIDLALDATDGYSDPVLMLYGPQRPNGSWPSRLAMNDDAEGLDSRITGFMLPADGAYLVVVAEYWLDAGTFELRLDVAGATECALALSVPPTDPRHARLEAPTLENRCTTDADCGTSGCSGEVCASAAESVITTCEAIELPAGSCSCVAGSCNWAHEVCGDLPGIGETCGAGSPCAAGLTCMTYCGISCAVQFSTCEISCLDGPCPGGLTCTTIADGPGEVCR